MTVDPGVVNAYLHRTAMNVWKKEVQQNVRFLDQVLVTLLDAERRIERGELPDGVTAESSESVVDFLQELRSNVSAQQIDFLQSLSDPAVRARLDETFGEN